MDIQEFHDLPVNASTEHGNERQRGRGRSRSKSPSIPKKATYKVTDSLIGKLLSFQAFTPAQQLDVYEKKGCIINAL